MAAKLNQRGRIPQKIEKSMLRWSKEVLKHVNKGEHVIIKFKQFS